MDEEFCMADLIKEMNLYLQDLLILQFKASKNITHKVTKGQLREKFVKQIVSEQYSNLILQSGILTNGEWQSTQGDFIWLKDNARVGNFSVYELSDCKMFMEIKSDAKHSELVHLNTVAGEIHQHAKEINPNERVIVGMFCYSTNASDKTILKKFGFRYDNDFQGYYGYDASKDIFKEIDFLFSLNISEDDNLSPYIVIRDIFGNCSLYNANPIITNFFNFFKQ